MRHLFSGAIVALTLGACTTDRVETEFADLSGAMKVLTTQSSGQIKRLKAADREEAITVAAQNHELWLLTDDCEELLQLDPLIPPQRCFIDKTVEEGTEPYIGTGEQIERKITVLRDYVDALGLLMTAQSEKDLNNSYAAALGALAGLNRTLDGESLGAFLKARRENQPKVEAVVDTAIEALRYRRLKQVVLASDADVATLVREIMILMRNNEFEPTFTERVQNLQAAAERAVEVDEDTPLPEYRAALVALRDEHEDFMKFYEKTIIYKTSLIARTHSDLAGSLRTNGKPEEMIAYLQSLKELAKVLGG